MRLLALVAAATGALFATTAAAQSVFGPNQYVSIAGGWFGEGDYDVEYPINAGRKDVAIDSTAGGEVALGTRWNTWRLEAAVSQRSHNTTTRYTLAPGYAAPTNREGEVRVRTLDLNAYYELPTGSTVRPYLGAGAGLASLDLKDGNLDEEGSSLHLQAMAGVTLDVSPRMALFAEGRVQRVGDFAVDTFATDLATGEMVEGTDEISFQNTAAFVGVRFGF